VLPGPVAGVLPDKDPTNSQSLLNRIMKNSLSTAPAPASADAQAVAANFKVAELETRKENIWVSGQESDTEIAAPKK
jgi:hypothetical protein